MHRRSCEVTNNASRLLGDYTTNLLVVGFGQLARRLRVMQGEHVRFDAFATFGSALLGDQLAP